MDANPLLKNYYPKNDFGPQAVHGLLDGLWTTPGNLLIPVLINTLIGTDRFQPHGRSYGSGPPVTLGPVALGAFVAEIVLIFTERLIGNC